VLAYRYRGELYRVVISGQDAGRVCGAAPTSWAKIALLVLGVTLFLAGALAFLSAL
jgi:hypothetical protein